MPLSLTNPWVILGLLAFLALCCTGTYLRGKDDMAAWYTKQELAQAKLDLKNGQKNNDRGQQDAEKFEQQKPQIVERVRERTNTLVIPPDADPFVPVWFVRMSHSLTSDEPVADPYPGESDAALSKTRLSGTREMLTRWAEKYETCRVAVDNIRNTKPVYPPPAEEKSLLEKLNPF